MPRFLVVLDVDSTLIDNEVIEMLAEAAGTRDQVSAVTAAAMNGELDFEQSLRTRVATLKGLPVDVFRDVATRLTVTKGVSELVDGVHGSGGRIGVVSGGFHEVIDPLAAGLKLDRWRANSLEVLDGTLTGRLRGTIIDSDSKASTLKEWAAIYDIPMRQTVAVGDGANDLRMMSVAGLSIGFDAKAPVRDEANILVNERDLSHVLSVLGLRG